jgi:hypothetical protein
MPNDNDCVLCNKSSSECECEEESLMEEVYALLSLRNSSFDELSAYGEVVDNSIQADASYVKIKLETTTKNIRSLAFGDNGCGMDAITLKKCLKIGFSSRFNDRVGIGRFGVGMKLGAIHQCKRIRIWSKQKGGEWLYSYLDLDEVESGQMTGFPTPRRAEPPVEYASLAGTDHGTLIIWDKYDNLRKRLMLLEQELPVWAGRTFRYFMWNEGPNGEPIPNRSHPLTIYINGEEVKAIDPLYHNTNRTRFPDDPQAKLYDQMTLDWPVDSLGLPEGAPENSDIRIRFSLLPEEWRKKVGSGGANTTTTPRAISPDSEGISIVRNYREVWFGTIPYWNRYATGDAGGWSRFEATDRWWGCEILFDAWLDRAFAVKNIKDGAIPLPKLMDTIKKTILPSRSTAKEEVMRVFAETSAAVRTERAREQAEAEKERMHAEAERIARLTPGATMQLGTDVDPAEVIDNFIQQRQEHMDAEEVAALKNLFESQPFMIEETNWQGNKFFESTHAGGSAILEYNMTHIFFLRIYELIDMLDEEPTAEDAAEIAWELKVMIDLMIMSYARAEANFAGDTMMRAGEFIDNMRSYWGQFLVSYINTRESEE